MAKCCAPVAMLSRHLSEASLFQTFPGPRKHAGQTEAPMNARTDVALTMDRLVEFVGMG
jgi:hypothetical protein